MATYLIDGTLLTAVANAIRDKTNQSDEVTFTPEQMATAILQIPEVVSSTVDVEEGSVSEYPEGTLYVVYGDGE